MMQVRDAAIVGSDTFGNSNIDVFQLMKIDPTLAGEYTQMLMRVDAAFAQDRLQRIDALRGRYDSLVVAARERTKVVAQTKNAHFEAASTHAAISADVDNASRALAAFEYDLKSNRTLFTFAEREARQAELGSLRTTLERAQLAQSAATDVLRQAIGDFDIALAEAKVADAQARDCEAELKRLSGKGDSKTYSQAAGLRM